MNAKDCEYFEQLLSSRLDESPTIEQEQELENHLAECPSCRDFGIELTSQRRIIQSLPDVVIPDGFRAVPNTLKWWRRRWSIPVPVAASFLAIAAAGWMFALVIDRTVDIPVRQTKPTSYCIETIRVTSSQAISIESDSTSFNSLREGI